MERKVTPAQERELALHYVEAGPNESGDRCAKMGLSRGYGLRAAAALGLKRPRWRKGTRYRDAKRDHSVNTFNDRRWERAKKIGTVVA
jgi:hypothetical protein